jgi:hypothetical protein
MSMKLVYEEWRYIKGFEGLYMVNLISNLEWAPQSEQNIHALETGLRKNPVGLKSGANGHAKRIKQLSIDGKLIRVFDCARDADRAGFKYKQISSCVTGRAKTHQNYKWEYA